jgi:hypothetical protein
VEDRGGLSHRLKGRKNLGSVRTLPSRAANHHV